MLVKVLCGVSEAPCQANSFIIENSSAKIHQFTLFPSQWKQRLERWKRWEIIVEMAPKQTHGRRQMRDGDAVNAITITFIYSTQLGALEVSLDTERGFS